MSRKYTAQEMREMALVEESYGWDVVAKMLRQAADDMESEENERLKAQLKAVGDYAAQTYELKEALRCIARSARAALKEEDV